MNAKTVLDQYFPITVDQSVLLENTPGLSSKDKEGISHLIAFDRIAERMFWEQVSSHGHQIHQAVSRARRAISPKRQEVIARFDQYLKALEINHGIHDDVSRKKFFPEFSKEDFLKATPYSAHALAYMMFSPEYLPEQPAGLNLYPKFITAASQAEPFNGTFCVVRGERHERLGQIPFEKAYEHILFEALPHYERAIQAFREAGREDFADHLARSKAIFTTTPANPEKRNLPWELSWVKFVRSMPSIDHVAGFIEDNMGFNNKAMWQSDLLVETTASQGLNALLADISSYETQLPYEASIREGDIPKPTTHFMDALFRSGNMAHGPTALANMLPNDSEVTSTHGAVTTMFTNIIDAKTDAILLPLIGVLIPESDIRAFDPAVVYDNGTPRSDLIDAYTRMAFRVGIAAHEATHFLSNKAPRKDIQEALKADSTMWEEGRAEAGRLYFLEQFLGQAIAKSNSSLDVNLATEYAYKIDIADMVRHLRFGREDPYCESALMRIAYFQDKGALAYVDGKFHIDAKKMQAASKELFTTHLKIITHADAACAQDFKDRFAHRGDELYADLMARTAHVPRDIFVTYTGL